MKLKAILLAAMLTFTGAVVAGCNEADVASQNLSTAADNFEIVRRVVFYNGITDTYMLTVEGYCSLGNHDSAGGTGEVDVCWKCPDCGRSVTKGAT